MTRWLSDAMSLAVWIKSLWFVHLFDAEKEACIASGEKVAGIQWDESSGPEVDAEMPEEELTPIGSHAIPAEQVPEAGPSLACAPVQKGRSDQVARDLGLGPGCGAVAGEFPPLAPSSADAARATPEEEVTAQERASTAETPTPTADYARSRLLWR